MPVSNEKLCDPRRAGRADAGESRESEACKQPHIDTALSGAPATVQLFVSSVGMPKFPWACKRHRGCPRQGSAEIHFVAIWRERGDSQDWPIARRRNGILSFNIDDRGNKCGVQLSPMNLAEFNSWAQPRDIFLQRRGTQ
jgi:hypothetical protein